MQKNLKTMIGLIALGAFGYGIKAFQTNHVESQTQALLQQQDYEGAIRLLTEKTQSSFDPVLGQRLARLLTTNPRLKSRNYAEAIVLSKRVIDSTYSTELKQDAVDTLACAYFANREDDLAREVAKKNHLDKRLEQFAIGRLCQDSVSSRDIASQK